MQWVQFGNQTAGSSPKVGISNFGGEILLCKTRRRKAKPSPVHTLFSSKLLSVERMASRVMTTFSQREKLLGWLSQPKCHMVRMCSHYQWHQLNSHCLLRKRLLICRSGWYMYELRLLYWLHAPSPRLAIYRKRYARVTGSSPVRGAKKFQVYGLGIFLSKPQAWYIIRRKSVYHQRRLSAVASHHASACIFLRLDEIQHYVLMICNSFGIDDIHALRRDFMTSCILYYEPQNHITLYAPLAQLVAQLTLNLALGAMLYYNCSV